MNVYIITINKLFDRFTTTEVNSVYASLEAAMDSLKDVEATQKEVLAAQCGCYKTAIKRSVKKGNKNSSDRQTVTLSYQKAFGASEKVIISIREEGLRGLNK